MNFVEKAVKIAKHYEEQKKTKNVTLYICSPFADNETLDALHMKISNVSNLNLRCYIREKCHREDLSRENQQRFPNTQYAGLYFHTKWAAYRVGNNEQVELLLTSANLVIHHLGVLALESLILNSMIIMTVKPNEFYENFLNRMDNQHQEGIPTASTLPAGNFDDRQIYQQVRVFVGKAVETSSKRPIQLHVVSPFMDLDTIRDIFRWIADSPANQPRVKIAYLHTEKKYAEEKKKEKEWVEKLRVLGNDMNIRNLELIPAQDFHCKYIAYGPDSDLVEESEEGSGQESAEDDSKWSVLMMSANIDSTHMNETQNSDYGNLDWTAELQLQIQDWKILSATIEERHPDKWNQKRWEDKQRSARAKALEMSERTKFSGATENRT